MKEQIEVFPQPKIIKFKRYKWCVGCSVVCMIISFILAIALPLIIPKLLKSQAEAGIVMVPQTEGLWAHVPGDTNTYTYRNFTFFNFTNVKDVVYFGKKPIFKQISGYAYYEFQDFEDIEYQNNSELVKFNFWLHFEKIPDSRNVKEKVKVINLGPIGFWSTLKNSDYPVFTIQGFGQLYFSLRDTFKSTALGQAISQQFLVNKTNLNGLAEQCGIDPATANFLWQDQIYGLSDPNNYEAWVDAVQGGIDSSASYTLKDYFALEQIQMKCMINSMNQWISALNLILNNWYCSGNHTACNSEELTFRQLSGSDVTLYPPPGTDSTVSICDQNITCDGSPEIYAYLRNVFVEQYPDKKQLFNLTFDASEMKLWFTPSKTNYCILHAGNLEYLWREGRLFDQNNNPIHLENLRKRFLLKTNDHTFVWWNWIKYFTKQFVLKEKQLGTKGIAGMGGVASQAIYQSFSAAGDWLKIFLLTEKLGYKLRQTGMNCNQIISQLTDLTDQKIINICSQINFDKPSTLQQIIQLCDNDYSKSWDEFGIKYNLTYPQIRKLCDDQEISFEAFITTSQRELNDYYECNLTPNPKCSSYELALKQWNNSFITLNPIPEITKPKSLTINSWNNEIPAYEYNYFLDYVEKKSDFRPNLTQLVDLLSFDKLFGGTMIQVIYVLNDIKQFQSLFYWNDPQLLRDYIRYAIIDIGFGGFTQERSVEELVFGYEDQFLRTVRDMDPAMGGDPSINILVALNELNSTRQQSKLYPQSMHTGKSDVKITRDYATINGYDGINLNFSYWDGNQIVNTIKDPWLQKDYFQGTDAFQNPPGLKPDNSNNMSIFITTLYRHGNVAYNTTVHKQGLDLYLCRMVPTLFQNKYDFPENKKYYQQYEGFLNLTVLNGAPLFVSANHFYHAPSNWSQLVDIYNQEGTFIYNASIYDDTYILVEPNTGTTLSATIYLQTNLLFDKDQLFVNGKRQMLPVFSLLRSGNASDEAVEKLFGPLKIALKIQKKSLYIGLLMSGLSMIIGLAVFMTYQRKKKERVPENALLYSLQNMQGMQGLADSTLRNNKEQQEGR